MENVLQKSPFVAYETQKSKKKNVAICQSIKIAVATRHTYTDTHTRNHG